MQHIPIRVLKRRIRKGLMDPINFATVVTDFTTCSNLWFHRGTTKCFVPTDYAADRAKCAPGPPSPFPWQLLEALIYGSAEAAALRNYLSRHLDRAGPSLPRR